MTRWRVRRHIFAGLRAQHEHAGHEPSPATWRRLKQEAARHAEAVYAMDAARRADPSAPPQTTPPPLVTAPPPATLTWASPIRAGASPAAG